MNLTRVLNAALPDLPATVARQSFPRLHPKLIARLQTDTGEPAIVCMIPGRPNMFRFSPEQWEVARCFDGRSFEGVAQLLKERLGWDFPEASVRAFADSLDEGEFWYRSPQEEIARHEAEQRRNRLKKKSKAGDMAQIEVWYWDPDVFFTWMEKKLRFWFTPWFNALTLALFLVMCAIFATHWGEIWNDSLQYYNFTEKGGLDLAEFYILFAVLAAFHESAHGICCKHYGGEVHKMGALLIYLTPAVFVETAEVFVYGTRWQRIITAAAGTWVELCLCSLATIVWWATAAGSAAHDVAYKFMLIGGIFVVIINMNPLIKMDGYYVFTELIRAPGLKEASTQFLSAWVRRTLFRMPVELPEIPPRRKLLHIVYPVLSGVYSYLVLFVVVRLVYHIFLVFTPDWAFVPAAYVAFLVFKGRLKKLLKFVRDLYLDKRELMRTHPKQVAAVAAVALVLLFAPLRRESVDARFIIEPAKRAVVRAMVPGRVVAVMAEEGDPVAMGAPLVRLRDLELDSESARATADYQVAVTRATQAQLRYADYGAAQHQARQLDQRRQTLRERQLQLELVAPLDGVVVTPRLHDLMGRYLTEGSEVAEIADFSSVHARAFIPEPELNKLGRLGPSTLKLDGDAALLHGTLGFVAPVAQEMTPGLAPPLKYKGMRPPLFYPGIIQVTDPQHLTRDGATGTARIFGRRRSIAVLLWKEVSESVGRKLW